jgi:hypothetical protein
MKFLIIFIVLVLALAAAPLAAAMETKPLTLQLKPKAALSAAATPNPNYAPFVMPASSDPEIDLLPRRDMRQDESRSACNNQQRSLCYDAASGRIEFRPARNFMPDLPGLQRETISVKRDRIIFKYSF